MKTNTKTTRSHVYTEKRLAGGYGVRAAKQDDEATLRRLVMSCLLWEDIAYAGGGSVADDIRAIIPNVDPDTVAQIAIEARFQQKLRHVPLLIAREMARLDAHKHLVASLLQKIIHRPDELAEFLAIYWKDQEKKTLSKQVKKGLAAAFQKFDRYQISKWDRPGAEIKLRDVLFLCHAKPKDQEQADLWKDLVNGTLTPPDTWEVGMSAAKTQTDKRDVWVRLLDSNKLGAFALLKNLRNMVIAKVPTSTVRRALSAMNPSMILPIDFLKAAEYAPTYQRELEDAMLRCAGEFPKIPGTTVFVVDVSGSMWSPLSSRSAFNRMDAAAAMAVLATEMCEHVEIYATAGSDCTRVHQTAKIRPYRGFALVKAIKEAKNLLGGGGIFTRQCLEYIRSQESEDPDRIVIFSDSQDCDLPGSGQPKPFGARNYIVDISSHSHGINYDGVWTAEVSGWSEHFLRYIAATEAQITQ